MSAKRVDSAGSGAYIFRERLLPPNEEEEDGGKEGHGGWCGCSICAMAGAFLREAMGKVSTCFEKGWEFAKSDPRKVIFLVKMGMASSLVSMLMFIDIPCKDINTYSVWAIFFPCPTNVQSA